MGHESTMEYVFHHLIDFAMTKMHISGLKGWFVLKSQKVYSCLFLVQSITLYMSTICKLGNISINDENKQKKSKNNCFLVSINCIDNSCLNWIEGAFYCAPAPPYPFSNIPFITFVFCFKFIWCQRTRYYGHHGFCVILVFVCVQKL